MSTNTALMSLQDELAQLSKTVSKPSGFNIKLSNKVFTLPDGNSSDKPIDVIILDWRNVNLYYPNVYNSQAPEGPACFAIGKIIDELSPTDVDEPVAPTCAVCKFNEFGSGANGRGKACKNTVKIAVVPVDATDETQPWIISIPPTSLTEWGNYVNTLGNSMGMLPVQVITQIGFDANSSFPKLKFGNPQPHDLIDVAMTLRPAAMTLLEATPSK